MLLASSAFANTVVPRPTNGGAWYTGITANDNPNDAFWDNKSNDDPNLAAAPGCNVGYWLGNIYWSQLIANCNNDGNVADQTSRGPGPLDFFASSGSAATPIGWDFLASGNNTVDMEVEVAGYRSGNVLGYYTVDSGGVRQYNATNVIYTGADTPQSVNKVITINAGVEFGFFLCANAFTFGGCNANTMFFSGDEYDGTNDRAGKFALFAQTPLHPSLNDDITRYYVGVEDLAGINSVEGIGDYNDLIFSANAKPRPIALPEAGFYWILALDLAGILFFIALFSKRLGLVR